MTKLTPEQQEFIQGLADEEGHIEPERVVEAGRDPGSPIHTLFEWNTSKAALSFWIEQARGLIRLVRVEFKVSRRTTLVPVFVTDPSRPPKSKRYIMTSIVSQDRELAEQVMADELGRIHACVSRARAVAGVLGLTARLQTFLGQVAAFREAVERAARGGRGARSGPGAKRARSSSGAAKRRRA